MPFKATLSPSSFFKYIYFNLVLACMDCDNCPQKFKGNCADCKELKKEREILKATDPVHEIAKKYLSLYNHTAP